jgi:hypothetical protein
LLADQVQAGRQLLIEFEDVGNLISVRQLTNAVANSAAAQIRRSQKSETKERGEQDYLLVRFELRDRNYHWCDVASMDLGNALIRKLLPIQKTNGFTRWTN